MRTLHDAWDDFEIPKDKSEIVKAPFAFAGGKERSILHLIPLLPVERAWVDCCGGSGIVTLNRAKSEIEIYNDRWSALTDFYKVIQDPEMFETFTGMVDVSIHSQETWEWAHVAQHDASDPMKRAFAWYYNNIYSFAALGRNFGRATRGTTPLAKKIDKKIPHFRVIHERMKHVQVVNSTVLNCLRDYDDYDTVFYIDPPYYPESPGIYKHSMKKPDHVLMLKSIFKVKGFVALSGYENELYDSPEWDWDSRHSWKSIVTIKAPSLEGNNREGTELIHKRDEAEEVLWIKEAR